MKHDIIFCFQMKDKSGPSLMTTVAMPVFSTKNETVSAPVTSPECQSDVHVVSKSFYVCFESLHAEESGNSVGGRRNRHPSAGADEAHPKASGTFSCFLFQFRSNELIHRNVLNNFDVCLILFL